MKVKITIISIRRVKDTLILPLLPPANKNGVNWLLSILKIHTGRKTKMVQIIRLTEEAILNETPSESQIKCESNAYQHQSYPQACLWCH